MNSANAPLVRSTQISYSGFNLLPSEIPVLRLNHPIRIESIYSSIDQYPTTLLQ